MSLLNKTIISTRPATQNDELKEYLSGKGAKVIDFPLIDITGLEPDETIQDVINIVQKFNWLIFTSKNGVFFFFRILLEYGITFDVLRNLKIASYGTKTTLEIEKFGLSSSFNSTSNTSHDFLAEIKDNIIKPNDRVLLILGELASSILENGLKEIADVTRINVYKTTDKKDYIPETLDLISNENYDLLLFTSPSGFRNFYKIINENNIHSKLKIGCIGLTTADEVKRLGYEPVLISSKPDGLNFALEIENYFN